MSRVLHLMRHDIRQHRRLLLAWTLLIVAQPVVAVLFRGTMGTPPAIDGVIPALLVIGARLLVGVVLVMTVVQQDAPLDDRSFWRTRPVAPATMAAAKLLLVAQALLGWPLLVTLGVAMVAQVPLSYWPTIAFQVLLVDGVLLGVALVTAGLTRHLSTGLVAAVLTVLLGLAVYSWASQPGVTSHAHGVPLARGVDPQYALPTLLMALVAGLWAMALTLWSGERGRRQAVGVAAAAAVAMLVVWYVPAARLHRRPVAAIRPPPVLRLERDRVRAFLLPTSPERVAVVTDVTIEGLEQDALADLWHMRGTLTTDGHQREARGPRDPNVGQRPGQPLAALLAVLSPEEFAALRGRPAQFRGSYRTSIVTRSRLAEGPLTPTTRLATPLGGLRLSGLTPETGALAAGHLTVLRRFPEAGRGIDLFLRDAETGRRAGTLFVWHRRTSLSYLLQLPTIARPFEWDPIELRWPANAQSALSPAGARLQMYEMDPPTRGTADAALTFVMPSEAAPAAK